MIPELLASVVKGEQAQNPEDVFFMYSVLANGANFYGDVARGKEFFHLARNMAGKLFDRFDNRVGCAFVLLSYYNFGYAEIDSATQYASIAKRMSHVLMKQHNEEINDLEINCLVALAYAEDNVCMLYFFY